MPTPIDMYITIDKCRRTDSRGSVGYVGTLYLPFGSSLLLRANVIHADGSAVEFAAGTEFTLAIDTDYNHGTAPLIRVSDYNFNWTEDGADPLNGYITCRFSTNDPTIESELGTAQTLAVKISLWAKPQGKKAFLVWNEKTAVISNVVAVPYSDGDFEYSSSSSTSSESTSSQSIIESSSSSTNYDLMCDQYLVAGVGGGYDLLYTHHHTTGDTYYYRNFDGITNRWLYGEYDGEWNLSDDSFVPYFTYGSGPSYDGSHQVICVVDTSSMSYTSTSSESDSTDSTSSESSNDYSLTSTSSTADDFVPAGTLNVTGTPSGEADGSFAYEGYDGTNGYKWKGGALNYVIYGFPGAWYHAQDYGQFTYDSSTAADPYSGWGYLIVT